MKITNEIIESYFDCKLKSYLKRKGERGQVNQIEDHYRRKLQHYREQVFQVRFAKPLRDGYTQIQSLSAFKITDAIYNVRVSSEHFDLFCDALRKKSVNGKLVLVPALVLPAETIEQKYKILISFIATELSRLLSCSIEYAEIIYSTKMMSKKIYLKHYSKHVRAISLSMEDQNSPFFCLNAHCSICEFQTTCRERAKASDHLSQLRGIGVEKIKKLNRKGIFTVNQLSYTFRPRRKPEKVDNRSRVRSFELQALAISQQKIFIYDLPERFPDAETEIFLDVEGLPQFNFYYLIGIAVKTREDVFYKSFWSSSKDDEQGNMIDLISTITGYDNYRIYHYGSYETAFLKAVQRKLGGQYHIAINTILGRCCNLSIQQRLLSSIQ